MSSLATAAQLRTPAAAPEQGLVFSALAPGSYGNEISVRVRPGSRTGVRITVELGAVLEDYDNLSAGEGPNPLMERLRRSHVVSADWASPSFKAPPAMGQWKLAGGSDGPPAEVADFLGNAGAPYDQRAGLAALGWDSGSGQSALTWNSDIGLVCLPDSTHPRFSAAESQALTEAVAACCESLNVIAILAVPAAAEGELPGAAVDSASVTFYYPSIGVPAFAAGSPVLVPPVGHVAGAWARHDQERGVHVSPHGMALRSFSDDLPSLSWLSEYTNRGVNPICCRSGGGDAFLPSAVTGAIDADRQPVAGGRFRGFFVRSLRTGLAWTIFEPAGEALYSEVRQQVEAFLHRLWSAGAIAGDRPEEAYSVQSTVDPGDDGRVIVHIGYSIASSGRVEINQLVMALPTAI